MLVSNVHSLGFIVNQEKRRFNPSQRISFLSLEFDLLRIVHSCPRRGRPVSSCAWPNFGWVTVRFRHYLRLLGMRASMMTVVPLGLLLLLWSSAHFPSLQVPMGGLLDIENVRQG